MKNTLAAVVLLSMFVLTPSFPQTSDADSGFGLQADIFRSIRNLSTDFTQNLSDLSDYRLTPGDRFLLTIDQGIFDTGTGVPVKSANIMYDVQLQQDGTLEVPIVGPISVLGMTIPEVRNLVTSGIRKSLAVQHVTFVLTRPAQFNVFVYGGVVQPGYIVATPMVTVLDALALSKGLKNGASYRSIELRRGDETLVLDVSKFFGEADFASNPTLRPGDLIYVPPARIIATVTGNIGYPGTYELVPGETLLTLIKAAGDVTPGSRLSGIEVNRIDQSGRRSLLSVPYSEAGSFHLMTGDAVTVRSSVENAAMVTIEGAVFGARTSGTGPVRVPSTPVRVDFPYFDGISLLAVLDGSGGPTPYALEEGAYLRRGATGETVLLAYKGLWDTRDPSADIELAPGDYILIPMQRLSVFVTGEVNDPGAQPFVSGYTISEYIMGAGGFRENRADIDAVFLVDSSGRRVRVDLDDEVDPGSVLYVGKRLLFAADQGVSNVLLAAGWVTAALTVVIQIITFLDLVGVR